MSGGTRIGLFVAFAVIAIVGGYYMFFIDPPDDQPVMSSTDNGTADNGGSGDADAGDTAPSNANGGNIGVLGSNPAPERPVDPRGNGGSSLLGNDATPPAGGRGDETGNAAEETDPKWDSVSSPLDEVEPIPPGTNDTTTDNGAQPPPPIVEDGGKDADDAPPIVEDGGKDYVPPTRTNDPPPTNQGTGGNNSNDQPERTTPPRTPPVQYGEYTVKSGDTMISIAATWFGDANKWDLIAKANPLVDPLKLQPEQKLRLPPKDMDRPRPEGEETGSGMFYTVQSGDSLTKIAQAFYKNGSKWEPIYEANKAIIGPDPGVLKVGIKLRIPPLPAGGG